MEVNEIPEIVVGRLSLGDLVMRFRLHGVDEVGELDCILNEEHRYVVADNIPVTLLGVEFDGETTDVTDGVSATARALDCRESNKDGSLSGGVSQNPSRGNILSALK